MRALVVIALVGTTARADVLTMRQLDSTNLHLANNRGAIHTSDDVTISVDLGAKGRVDVVSKGTRGQHDMYVMNGASYSVDEKATWTTTWLGTWRVTKGVLALDLSLVKDACSAVRDEGGTKSNQSCRAATKRAVLECTTETIEVETGAKKPAKVAAWRCTPDDKSALGESPSSWVLGKDRCIEVRGGRKTPFSYGRCAKP